MSGRWPSVIARRSGYRGAIGTVREMPGSDHDADTFSDAASDDRRVPMPSSSVQTHQE